eukprot:scaffold22680_cov107-Cylindrotheca_fusiformis.AAC.22
MESAPSMDEGCSTQSHQRDEDHISAEAEQSSDARQIKEANRVGSLSAAEQEKLRTLRSQRTLPSSNQTARKQLHRSTFGREETAPEPAGVKRSGDEKSRQLKQKKGAVQKMKRKHRQTEQEIQNHQRDDVDDTLDTTQSSEQRFLTLEDVKGIIEDSRILSCVGDKQMLADVDGGEGMDPKEEEGEEGEEDNLLVKLKGTLKESLELLTSPTSTLPSEISFSADAGENVKSQISFLDKEDEESVQEDDLLKPIPERSVDEASALKAENGTSEAPILDKEDKESVEEGNLPKLTHEDNMHTASGLRAENETSEAPILDKEDKESVQEDDLLKLIHVEGDDEVPGFRIENGASEAPIKNVQPTREDLGQLTGLQRKISEVIMQQAQEESLKQKEERRKAETQKREEDGIRYLREKAMARHQMEEAARKKVKDEDAARWLKVQKDTETSSCATDHDVVPEHTSMHSIVKLTQPIRRALTNLYPAGGNEMTLEEYEKQMQQHTDEEAEKDLPTEKKKKKSFFTGLLRKPKRRTKHIQAKKQKKGFLFSRKRDSQQVKGEEFRSS